MSCQSQKSSGCSTPQFKVDQTPRFENSMRRGRRTNQVIGRKGQIIRPDRRKKVRYL